MPQPPKEVLARLTTEPEYIPDIPAGPTTDAEVDALEIKIASDDMVSLTLEKATEYIDLPVFSGERVVTDSNVAKLRNAMVTRTFNWSNVILASAWLNGVRYKLNGQHTCWARMFVKGHVPAVREVIYRCKTEQQLRLLYATFDAGLGRPIGHLLLIHLLANPLLAALRRDTLRSLGSATRPWLYEAHNPSRAVSVVELATIILDKHVDLFCEVDDFFSGYTSDDARLVRRQPIYSALLETFHANTATGDDFWGPVVTGANLDYGDARLTLRNYLMEHALGTKRAGAARGVVGQEDMYRCAVWAWNCWREGRKITKLKTPSTRPKAK